MRNFHTGKDRHNLGRQEKLDYLEENDTNLSVAHRDTGHNSLRRLRVHKILLSILYLQNILFLQVLRYLQRWPCDS